MLIVYGITTNTFSTSSSYIRCVMIQYPYTTHLNLFRLSKLRISALTYIRIIDTNTEKLLCVYELRIDTYQRLLLWYRYRNR